MITVTKTFMPPLGEYNSILQRIWEDACLTNRGKLVKELEEKLTTYLNVTNMLITNNGTIPLQLAMKLLGKGGEVITTPFSYVATSSAILWENCKPVFVDIHPGYLTIDESKIEAAITPQTTCILATHVFGNPCDVEAIETIAGKYQLSVIYDAAHCFGVTYKDKSIFEYGDVSTCSFHATKLFHTAEGGAVFCKDEELSKQLFQSHNFGHDGPHAFHRLGINAKISELQAAMGLAVFPHLSTILIARKQVVEWYESLLDFSKVTRMQLRPETQWNFSYLPIIFNNESLLLKTEKALNKHHIFPRRYFYPSLNTIHYIHGERMPIAESIASRILCLPLYVELDYESIVQIVKIIHSEN